MSGVSIESGWIDLKFWHAILIPQCVWHRFQVGFKGERSARGVVCGGIQSWPLL